MRNIKNLTLYFAFFIFIFLYFLAKSIFNFYAPLVSNFFPLVPIFIILIVASKQDIYISSYLLIVLSLLHYLLSLSSLLYIILFYAGIMVFKIQISSTIEINKKIYFALTVLFFTMAYNLLFNVLNLKIPPLDSLLLSSLSNFVWGIFLFPFYKLKNEEAKLSK